MLGITKDSKTIYLYRHGETNWNVDDRITGQLDDEEIKFTDLGYRQIEKLSQELKANNVQVIYCSDYKRTSETANIANSKLGIPIFYQKELHGLNMGKYQGNILLECSKEREFRESFQDYNLPIGGGESVNQLNARIKKFILKICKDEEYSRIAIITHSAVISNLKALLTQKKYISLDECTLLYSAGQLSVIDYVCNGAKYDKQKMKNVFFRFGGDLILIRHGENLIDSTIDNDLLPLTEFGIEQAEKVRKILDGCFDIVISSTSMRCVTTAKIIANNMETITDRRLLERGWGNKEYDGKETNEQAKERFMDFLNDINERYHGKRVVVVTHGSFMKLAQDIVENKCEERERIDNCDIIEYNRSGMKKITKLCLL